MRLLALALLLAGCRSSGMPWGSIEFQIEEKGRVTIKGSASVTGGTFEFTAEGPVKTVLRRPDGTVIAPEEPKGP